MVERHETDQEESNIQGLSAPKNNSKVDMAEFIRRRGPEFEPIPEDIAEKQRSASQGTGQSSVSPTTDPAGKTNDDETQQKKDAELAREIEELEQKEIALKNQKLPELEEQLRQIQQNQEDQTPQADSENDQNEEYSQGMGY